MPKKDITRERLDKLFAEIEKLAKRADESPEILRELESLYARVRELETKFSASDGQHEAREDALVSVSQPRATASIRYEKERIAYVAYSDDRLEALQGPPPVLPDGKEAITAPLVASGHTIGEMRVAPPEREWTPEEVSLTQAVAQQVSLQVQNLRLLAATELARADAELATRRFTREGWDSYLDAIHQSERPGYAYDQNAVMPYETDLPVDEGIMQDISVTGEKVGALYLKADPSRPLTDADKKMIDSAARQLSLQIENLRLLADAARARAEAEEATRLLTRENWLNFLEDREEMQLSFVYDNNQVIQMDAALLADRVSHSQPLTVRGEAIGQLAITSDDHSVFSDQTELMAAVASQVSLHIEALRLNEELQKRARELQELDRLKSAFLANMSHELRTPLNSILGFSDVILEELDGPLTPNMQTDLRLIQKNGQHLLHLINDVLDMAKIESGRMNLHPELFNVHSLIEDVISITSTLASEKNIALFVDETSDPDVEIFADNTRLRQVMINLVNNSIKFTEQGKIAVKVVLADSATALISVKDTGLGIPPEQLDAIFQEFTQVDTSTTRKVGGTGLGLPISRRLVEMHGGRLWADSTGVAGEGSTFYVEMPLEARIADVIEKKEK